MSIFGAIFLGLFGLTLFSAYIVIRRDLLNIRSTGLLCAAIASSSLFAFGVVEELQLLHSFVVALVLGLGFSAAVIVMAAFFKNNQAPELEAVLARPASGSEQKSTSK